MQMDATKPTCLACERPLSWLARLRFGRFCCSQCATQYREKMTSLALDRLSHTALMPEVDHGATITVK
jgi:hypothetical protein